MSTKNLAKCTIIGVSYTYTLSISCITILDVFLFPFVCNLKSFPKKSFSFVHAIDLSSSHCVFLIQNAFYEHCGHCV